MAQPILFQLIAARATIAEQYNDHYNEAVSKDMPSDVIRALFAERCAVLSELDKRINAASPIPMPPRW